MPLAQNLWQHEKSPDHMDQGIDFPSSRLAHAAVIPTKVGIQKLWRGPWIPAFARMAKGMVKVT